MKKMTKTNLMMVVTLPIIGAGARVLSDAQQGLGPRGTTNSLSTMTVKTVSLLLRRRRKSPESGQRRKKSQRNRKVMAGGAENGKKELSKSHFPRRRRSQKRSQEGTTVTGKDLYFSKICTANNIQEIYNQTITMLLTVEKTFLNKFKVIFYT